MGLMKEMRGNYFTVAGLKPFHNGDGACFIDENGKLTGFRINKVEGNKIFPLEMPHIKPKTVIYRNYDHEFDKLLSKTSSTRTIGVQIKLTESVKGFTLQLFDEDGNEASVQLDQAKEEARTPQKDNIIRQLSKLGNTPFYPAAVEVTLQKEWFVPSSILNEARREAVEQLIETRKRNYRRIEQRFEKTSHQFITPKLTYLGNVMNSYAHQFYAQHGVTEIAPAFEKKTIDEAVLMFCKHCIRYSMGWCPTFQQDKSPYREPFCLVDPNGSEFKLQFDCKNCQMKVMRNI